MSSQVVETVVVQQPIETTVSADLARITQGMVLTNRYLYQYTVLGGQIKAINENIAGTQQSIDLKAAQKVLTKAIEDRCAEEKKTRDLKSKDVSGLKLSEEKKDLSTERRQCLKNALDLARYGVHSESNAPSRIESAYAITFEPLPEEVPADYLPPKPAKEVKPSK